MSQNESSRVHLAFFARFHISIFGNDHRVSFFYVFLLIKGGLSNWGAFGSGLACTQSFLLVRLEVVDHVAHLCRSKVALEALQKLVGPAGCLVDHKTLAEAYLGRVGALLVSDTALDDCFF